MGQFWGLLILVTGLLQESTTKVLDSKLDVVEVINSPNPPIIGAYRKNFKGVTTEVLSEASNSELTLPYLNIEDNFYFGKTIQLTCNASYPVQWVYSGDGTPALHTETFRLARDFNDPDSYSFYATVVFSHTVELQTGNYTCQGINEPGLQTYFYVFVPGNLTFLLDDGAKSSPRTMYVKEQMNGDWITFPCTVTNSSTKVELYKYKDNGTLEQLKENKTLVFDPKIGFSLLPKEVKDLLGDYLCIAQDSKGQGGKVNIGVRLLLANETDQDNLKPMGENTLEIVYDPENHRLVCCNNLKDKKKVRPHLKSASCESISDCNMKNQFVRRKKCPGMCEQHETKVNSSCVAFQLSETREAGIIECYVGEHVAFHQFSKEQDIIITEFNELPKIEEVLSIMKEDISHIKTKADRDRYVCHANSFFFSTGLKMAWENPDGTMHFVDETHFPLSNAIEIDTNENTNTTRLFCFAPLWNSPMEWRNVSIYVN